LPELVRRASSFAGVAGQIVAASNGGRLQMVALRKELDLVWVWFYKEVAPTTLFKGANPANGIC